MLITNMPPGPMARWSMSPPDGQGTACKMCHPCRSRGSRRFPVTVSPVAPMCHEVPPRAEPVSTTALLVTASPGSFKAKSYREGTGLGALRCCGGSCGRKDRPASTHRSVDLRAASARESGGREDVSADPRRRRPLVRPRVPMKTAAPTSTATQSNAVTTLPPPQSNPSPLALDTQNPAP